MNVGHKGLDCSHCDNRFVSYLVFTRSRASVWCKLSIRNKIVEQRRHGYGHGTMYFAKLCYLPPMRKVICLNHENKY